MGANNKLMIGSVIAKELKKLSLKEKQSQEFRGLSKKDVDRVKIRRGIEGDEEWATEEENSDGEVQKKK